MPSRIARPLALTLAAGLAPEAPAAPPLQCRLGALTRAERARQGELIVRVRRAVTARRDVPGGYVFDLDPSVPVPEVAEWLALESRCCPFLDLALELDGDGRGRRVRLTGGRGVKAFVAAEMGDGCPDG